MIPKGFPLLGSNDPARQRTRCLQFDLDVIYPCQPMWIEKHSTDCELNNSIIWSADFQYLWSLWLPSLLLYSVHWPFLVVTDDHTIPRSATQAQRASERNDAQRAAPAALSRPTFECWVCWPAVEGPREGKIVRIDVGWCIYGGFHKWGYPIMDGLRGEIPLRSMIWGYPHFRKPPYIGMWCYL